MPQLNVDAASTATITLTWAELAGFAAAASVGTLLAVQFLRDIGAARYLSRSWRIVSLWPFRSTVRATAADPVLAGVELGGTTSVAAIAVGRAANIVESVEVPTEGPEETVQRLAEWLRDKHEECGGLAALGIATFGPVNVSGTVINNAQYGVLGRTPKPRWAGFALIPAFTHALSLTHPLPMRVDTDVNAPAVAEARHDGRCARRRVVVYVTVGTGVGVGAFVHGAALHGRLHPEGGHVYAPRQAGDAYPGACSLHGDCLEGMLCARALAERAGVSPAQLPQLSDEHVVWDTAAYYLAHLCVSIACLLAPERIVLGGGILKRVSLYERVWKYFDALVNGYLGETLHAAEYIVAPRYGDRAGIVGACDLAQLAYAEVARSSRRRR
ncbi:hypothetical protein CDCA_CDCA13G3592 [Cyanidium caldarium]|uniref:fructokinase n=1 Tax=Cyanidium caldarium TaxID=2771 RepID=A0AAV9IZ30_CYACA|nr:hypothetical protein CDCA_CDCA13G3592 [Cyanidium caldarium]